MLNVKFMFGLSTRDSQLKSNNILFNTIRENNLCNYDMSQYKDLDGDYIWCVFHEGALDSSIEDVVNYMLSKNERIF